MYLCGVVDIYNTTTSKIIYDMKKVFITAIITLTAAMSLNAQLLWKISGNGIERDSYIFGTHHIAPVTMLDSVPGFNDALKAVDAIYGEVAMEDMNSPKFLAMMQQAVMAPADSTLDKVLTPIQLDSVAAFLGKYIGAQFDIRMLYPMKPSAITSQLAILMSKKIFPDFEPSKQIDLTIQSRAKALGKKNGGLESVSDQVKALFGNPISQQAEELMETVRDEDKALKQALALANAYRSQNLGEITSIIFDPDNGMTEEEQQRPMNERNNKWAQFLIGFLPTASVMVVVGAGHLPGNNGLINLLQKAGFNVTPVMQ